MACIRFHALVLELNRQGKGHAVVDLVDGRDYATNDAVIAEYLTALVRTNRLRGFAEGNSVRCVACLLALWSCLEYRSAKSIPPLILT